MNERIKELAEQADSYALATIGNLWIGWEEKNPGWEDCRDQKFAELIVRECMDNLAWHGHDEAVSQLEWFKLNKLGIK